MVLSCTCGIKLWSYGSIIDFGYKYPKIFKVYFFEYFLDIHIQKSTLFFGRFVYSFLPAFGVEDDVVQGVFKGVELYCRDVVLLSCFDVYEFGLCLEYQPNNHPDVPGFLGSIQECRYFFEEVFHVSYLLL